VILLELGVCSSGGLSSTSGEGGSKSGIFVCWCLRRKPIASLAVADGISKTVKNATRAAPAPLLCDAGGAGGCRVGIRTWPRPRGRELEVHFPALRLPRHAHTCLADACSEFTARSAKEVSWGGSYTALRFLDEDFAVVTSLEELEDGPVWIAKPTSSQPQPQETVATPPLDLRLELSHRGAIAPVETASEAVVRKRETVQDEFARGAREDGFAFAEGVLDPAPLLAFRRHFLARLDELLAQMAVKGVEWRKRPFRFKEVHGNSSQTPPCRAALLTIVVCARSLSIAQLQGVFAEARSHGCPIRPQPHVL